MPSSGEVIVPKKHTRRLRMEVEIEAVTNLVTALENAVLMAKQLPSTTTTTDSANIYASLQAAHRHLSLFLAQTSPPPPQQPSDVSDDAPMQMADEEQQLDDGEDSKMATIDSVEQQMRDCFIQKKKRQKRSLSPTSFAAGERRRWLEYEIESARAVTDYDPHVTKMRALDLIYQFHC